jgi:DNA-binding cell septation regulator SpoVG
MNTIRILDWKPVRKNTLLGFCIAEFASGLVIGDITILNGERGPWASPPSKPMITGDGTVMKDAGGKIRYSPFIAFTTKEIRSRWSDLVIEAMRATHPEALDGGH